MSFETEAVPLRARVLEVMRVFGVLGVTAFGGPAAHVAAMEDEVVRKRGWVSREEFVDLLSAANVIPGPNSTELAIHLGYRRAGVWGLVVAGVSFIVPATVMVWVIAMGYARYGMRREVHAMLVGMQPVVLAVVVQAMWRLGRSVLRTSTLVGLAVVSTVAVVMGVNELVVLAASALAAWALHETAAGDASHRLSSVVVVAGAATPIGVFASFVKIGSVLFGSGYVLLAFLRAEFVQRHAWLTEGQVLDAIAIGQVTPGPVFTSATFVGYQLAGHAGAAAATAGIFLPAFVFVAISGPFVSRIRESARATAVLDGVNAASLAMMAGVVVLMMRGVAMSVVSVIIFVVAGAFLLRTKVGAGWMLLAGAVVGVLYSWL